MLYNTFRTILRCLFIFDIFLMVVLFVASMLLLSGEIIFLWFIILVFFGLMTIFWGSDIFDS